MCVQNLPQAGSFPVRTPNICRVKIRKVHGPKKDFLVPYKNEYDPLVLSLHVYAVWTLLQNIPPDMNKQRKERCYCKANSQMIIIPKKMTGKIWTV